MSMYFRFPYFKLKALTLSYDDGREYDRKMVEILNRNGIHGTFNLNSGKLGTAGFVKAEEVSKLYADHEVAAHTFSHPFLPEITPVDLVNEIMEDRKRLERLTGKIVEGLAYPFGLDETNGEPETAALCGITYARTTVSTGRFDLPKDFMRWETTCHHTEDRLFDLVDRFLQPLAPQVRPARPRLFYMWGHSYEFGDNDNWALLEKFCMKVGRQPDVWYATNGEIARYIRAYRSLQKSCDGSLVFNPTGIRIFAGANGKNIIFEPGAMTKL